MFLCLAWQIPAACQTGDGRMRKDQSKQLEWNFWEWLFGSGGEAGAGGKG